MSNQVVHIMLSRLTAKATREPYKAGARFNRIALNQLLEHHGLPVNDCKHSAPVLPVLGMMLAAQCSTELCVLLIVQSKSSHLSCQHCHYARTHACTHARAPARTHAHAAKPGKRIAAEWFASMVRNTKGGKSALYWCSGMAPSCVSSCPGI